MKDLMIFDTIGKYCSFNKNEVLHPLVSVIDLGKAAPRLLYRARYDFYTVFIKDIKCGNLRYGCNYYDYEKGTIIFVAPGQVIGVENDGVAYQPQGKVLAFHPDFIRGTALGKAIKNYTFFSYNMHEALHLSDAERKNIEDCYAKIEAELQHAIDKHTKTLVVSNIELLLNYCTRYYDRQFITREAANRGILERFENLLDDYFISDRPQTNGLPSVAWCADQLHLSANYFGDLVKKETGKTAHAYIQAKLIDTAKELVFNKTLSLGQIAYELGFKYPQHFTRLFKQQTGKTPHEYRSVN